MRQASGPSKASGPQDFELTGPGIHEHIHRSHRTTGEHRIQVRVRHRRRAGHRAQGAQRGRRPPDLGEEGRARVAARVAAEGVSRLAQDDRADVAERHVRADRLPGHQLLRGAEGEEEARTAWTKSIRRSAPPSRSSAFRSIEQQLLAGVAVDAVFDSVSVATTFREKLAEARHHLLLVLRGGARASRSGASSISARSCRTPTTSSPRSTRRCSATAASSTCRRACAARWSCPPTSASTPRTPGSSSGR